MIIAKKLINVGDKIQKKNVCSIFKSEFFVFANSFLGIYVLNAPKYAIDSFLTEQLQAIYGYIVMPGTVMVLFAQFIVLPFLNKLTELYAEKNFKEFRKLTNRVKLCIIAFGIFAVLAAYFLGPEVLGFIYGQDLTAYRINLAMIIGAYIFYAISYVNLVMLTTTRHTFVQFVVYIITTVVAFIGSRLLVQNYGINGASLSCVVTLTSQFIMYTVMTKIIIRKLEKQSLVEQQTKTNEE